MSEKWILFQWTAVEETSVFIWAGPWENVSYVICEQQRRRSACTSAQSDQRLCCSLPRQFNVSSFCNQNFKPHASFCSWAGQFESDLVGTSRRHETHLVVCLCFPNASPKFWCRSIDASVSEGGIKIQNHLVSRRHLRPWFAKCLWRISVRTFHGTCVYRAQLYINLS